MTGERKTDDLFAIMHVCSGIWAWPSSHIECDDNAYLCMIQFDNYGG
jgi:hypothetical protein